MISSSKDPYYLVKAQIRAFSKGGECLSTDCSGATDVLVWSCQHGHQWHAQLGKVLRGSWCPECERRQATHSPTQIKRR